MSKTIKNAILRILSKRQAEQALFIKTLLLHVINKISKGLTGFRRWADQESQPIFELSDPRGQTSFGYYDITPFSMNNELLLATLMPKHSAPPKSGETISIGFFDLTGNRKFQDIGTTSTWCWQQGCRLQWYPHDENKLIIYNKLVNGAYGSVVQNISTGEIVSEYHNPIYTIERSGRWAVFPNFSRLNRLRPGYGYVDLPDRSEGIATPSDDGVYLADLERRKVDLLITFADLALLEASNSMSGAEHYVNHFCFNPSGDKFLFFHLWDTRDGSHARLMICDRLTGSLKVLEDRGAVSHYAWKSDDELLATFNYANKVGKYQLYGSEPRKHQVIQADVLTRDGHPSYSPDGTMILTDTYADKDGNQHLLLLDAQQNVIELGRFPSPIMIRLRHNGEVRCDLHPRWDRQGRYICFDSAHSGKRAMYVYDIQNRPNQDSL